jgi:hypothetical protein
LSLAIQDSAEMMFQPADKGLHAKPENMTRDGVVCDSLAGFGEFNRTGYRPAKRTFRSASDTDGPTAGALISYQNFESVADCILSQW